MTEEFELRDAWVRLRLCGLDFQIELCKETARVCGEILKDAKQKLAQIKASRDGNELSEGEVCQFLKCSIDRLLGIGSVDRIFGSRRQELFDLADLMCYVVSKIRNGFENGAKNYKRAEKAE